MTKPAPSTAPRISSSRATLEVTPVGEAALVKVGGLIDERFQGFGEIPQSIVVIDVSGINRMTSFGVRQWLKSMEALPPSITDVYLVRCPPFFVDQLNMVLNFGGSAKVVTVLAPYTCLSCGVETDELIDVLVERENIAAGAIPKKNCTKCGAVLQFDEIPASYFACVSKYGATSLHPAAAALLGSRAVIATTSRPVAGAVTTTPGSTPSVVELQRRAEADAQTRARARAAADAPSWSYAISGVGMVVHVAIVIALVVAAYVVGKST